MAAPRRQWSVARQKDSNPTQFMRVIFSFFLAFSWSVLAQRGEPALTILKQPDDVKQEIGKPATFVVSVEARQTPAFQWFKNGVAIPDATASSYATPPVRLVDHGAKFKAVITSGTNSVESREGVLTVVAAARETVRGFLKADVFTGIGGTSLEADLRAHSKYIENRPDRSEFITSFEYPPASTNGLPPADFLDDYGVRITGFIVPQVTGRYTFYIASDGPGELYLSPHDSPAGQALIAREPQGNAARAFASGEGRPGCPDACENASAAITLEAGKRYFVRAEMKESSGSDHLAVTWILEGDAPPSNGAPPISSSYIATEANPHLAPEIQITQQPQNLTVPENASATLTVAATSTTTISVQWQKAPPGSSAFNDIPGANSTSHTTSSLRASETGTRYRAVLSVPGRSVLTGEAVVTVQRDPNAATFESVKVEANNLILTWTGAAILQSAPDIMGPWTDVTGATSPFRAPLTGTRKFFRLKK